MRPINYSMILLIKLFRKIYEWSNKFNCPIVKNVLYNIYFRLLFCNIKPYLNNAFTYVKKSKRNIGKYNSKIIWVFWWQGLNDMPLIVQRCIESIKKNSNKYRVILITRYNITKYTNIPMNIYSKLKNGNITLTHFSDILRFNLLYNHGGLWCDSTLYCTSNLSKQYFNYLYTSGGYLNTSPKFVSGRWTGFLIGGNKYNSLFKFMCEYFRLYWKINKYQLAYFLIDLGLYYAYIHNIGNFKTYVKYRACYNNPNMFKLSKLLNSPYDSNELKKLEYNTNIFKLTYKINFISGPTYYHWIIGKDK